MIVCSLEIKGRCMSTFILGYNQLDFVKCERACVASFRLPVMIRAFGRGTFLRTLVEGEEMQAVGALCFTVLPISGNKPSARRSLYSRADKMTFGFYVANPQVKSEFAYVHCCGSNGVAEFLTTR